MLYQLSYTSFSPATREESLERETRIELATNSLEGCDSTIELLPPALMPHCTAPTWNQHAGRAAVRVDQLGFSAYQTPAAESLQYPAVRPVTFRSWPVQGQCYTRD